MTTAPSASPRLAAPRDAGLVEIPFRWRVTGPLEGWREDDPDAVLRCSIDPEHAIANGDHYAINGIKVACLDCTKLPAPAAAAPAPVKTPRAFISEVDRRFGGMSERKPKAQPAPAPPPKLRVPAPLERRTCAHGGCLETFEVRPTSKKRFHSKSCAVLAFWETRSPRASREERTRTCGGCGESFVVDRLASSQRFCGVGCGQRKPAQSIEDPGPIAAPAEERMPPPDPDLATCPCLRHANERLTRGMRPPPIRIGEYEFQVFAPYRADGSRP